MLKDKLSGMILETMKTGDTVRREALRAFKAGIQNFMTAEKAVRDESGSVIYTEADEIGILKSLIKQEEKSISQYSDAGRMDLVEQEQAQLKIFEELLPSPATEEDITAAFNELCTTIEPTKKNMGTFVKSIKAKYPVADGKLVASIVGSRLT